ncbi:DUF2380 domain-containing protein [Methylobacterium sp. W2]|uniref:DUF2380 domain-containing protein n=1 Tax=Methylobacterium sp. W2 TaxID=2598107 RepID=UPI001D0C7B72|nr:DUF2380 domain-containing protein [Methylobacterium sp. W2]MCC0809312.1 DUF2380 domain-containing protein [Methylobacterium sp. W2]
MGAAGLLLTALASPCAHAAEALQTSLVVLPIKLLDTSGEPTDQTAQHAERLLRLANGLATNLTRSGLFRATVLPADNLRQDCPSEAVACLLKAAQGRGAELILVGVVHKSSTLIMQLWARLVDARTGRDHYSRDLNFRGDTDESWQRAEQFLISQIHDETVKARGE